MKDSNAFEEDEAFDDANRTEAERELETSEGEPNLAAEDTCFKAPAGNLDSILR